MASSLQGEGAVHLRVGDRMRKKEDKEVHGHLRE